MSNAGIRLNSVTLPNSIYSLLKIRLAHIRLPYYPAAHILWRSQIKVRTANQYGQQCKLQPLEGYPRSLWQGGSRHRRYVNFYPLPLKTD